MNRKKPYFLKRVVAYLIDLIIVSVLSSLLTTVFIGNNVSSLNYTQELLSLREKLEKKEITDEEYTEQSNILIYINAKDTVGMSIIVVGVSLVYYVVLCYYCNGVTLGKRLLELQIVSANDKKLNIGHFLLRALLVNMILSNITSVVLVTLLNKDTFMTIYPKVSNVLTIFLLVTLVFIMYREDGRGLHDLAANTKIISTKEEKVKKEDVVEAKVLEEKKSTKKNKKEKSVNKE